MTTGMMMFIGGIAGAVFFTDVDYYAFNSRQETPQTD